MSPGSDGNDLIRVLSYNLRDLKDDRAAIVRIVRALRPDVACLQEVPRHPFAGHRVGSLADDCGLLWSGGGVRSGGTAVLTSLRVDQRAAHAARLPVGGRFARSRGYAVAVVGIPGGPVVTVASVHLSLDQAERQRHARLILDQVGSFGTSLGASIGTASRSTPYVIAGDLNEPPDGPAWRTFGSAKPGPPLQDAAALNTVSGAPEPTFPARAPRRRIDAVLVSSGITVESVRVPGAADGVEAADLVAASDHLPVLADLRLLPSSG